MSKQLHERKKLPLWLAYVRVASPNLMSAVSPVTKESRSLCRLDSQLNSCPQTSIEFFLYSNGCTQTSHSINSSSSHNISQSASVSKNRLPTVSLTTIYHSSIVLANGQINPKKISMLHNALPGFGSRLRYRLERLTQYIDRG
jgi:hypothetical protein